MRRVSAFAFAMSIGVVVAQGSPLVTVEDPDVFRGAPLTVHNGFVPAIERIRGYAKEAGVTLYVTGSVRSVHDEIEDPIVSPASRSNHLAGYAIDLNVDLPDGTRCDSVCLGDLSNASPPVRRFIQLVRSDAARQHDQPQLRWGGDFRTPDPVHIDDGLNLRDAASYDAFREEVQRALGAE